MGSFATYDPKAVVLVLDGNPISGYTDGSFISIAFDEQQWEKTTGADGHTARAKSNNYTGTLTLTLMATSIGNDILNALWQRDRRNNSGAVQMTLRDTLGRTVWSAQNAWVQQMPDQEFSKEVGEREWVLDCDELFGTMGGNQALPA